MFLSNLYPPNVVGGYERLAFSVAEALVLRGHDIHVLTSSYGGVEANYPGQSVVRRLRLLADDRNIYEPLMATEDRRIGINLDNISALRSEIDRIRPDAIFVWNLYFFDGSLMEAVVSSGVPAVLFLTDNWLAAAQMPEKVGAFFARFVHGPEAFTPGVDLGGDAGRTIDVSVIFGSNFVRNFYASCGYRFLNNWVVHNGVPMSPDIVAPSPDRTALYRPGMLRLLFAGRVVDIKGPDLCVRSLKHVRAALGEDIELELLIVGDDQDASYFASLQKLIDEDTSRARIRIVPPMPEDKLSEIWNTYDIYLFPSRYEPFSLTLILAMAAGIPTLASDIPGNDEIVFDGRTGLTFRSGDEESMADQIVALARDGEGRERMANRARVLGQKFTFRRMIDQVDLLLRQVAT